MKLTFLGGAVCCLLEIKEELIFSLSKSHPAFFARRLISIIAMKEKADDWTYFIDNLIRIENRKVCVILGLIDMVSCLLH